MKKEKIVFVEPEGSEYNVYSKFMKIPLLGPLYLATQARSAGYRCSVINENILRRKISETELLDADILCLTCMTSTVTRGLAIGKQYKNLRTAHNLSSRTIIGGIHPSMLPDTLKNDFDCVVCGEGEMVLNNLLSDKSIKGVVQGRKVEDLDSLPIPDYSLIEGNPKLSIWPVMTSRGCPHSCNFCSVTKMFGQSYRAQSPQRVLEEIMAIRSGAVFFVDDNFAANRKRTHAIVDGMLKYKFRRPWSAQVRSDITRDFPLVKKMAIAGCRVVYVGLESVNPRSLDLMKKRQKIEEVTKSIKLFRKAGIQVHGMFMLGNDPDTPEIFSTTSKFAKKAGLNFIQYNVLTPLPGTELFSLYEKDGRILHKNWQFYDGLHVVFKPSQMSPLALQKGMLSCFRSYYNYKSAMVEAYQSGLSALRSGINSSLFHHFFPSFMKVVGKSIIHSWERQNSSYLKYLQSESNYYT
ncbi:radical SAM domain protein [Chitinispirillum alkaliphilum]|nr:radical SAM domain protein [Chitinispirillum alkaliphilum]